MNSYEILKQLKRMAQDHTMEKRQRMVIEQAIRHIESQDGEILELRVDITDLTIPPNED